MDRNTAFEILKKHVKEDFYIKHSLGVEAIMSIEELILIPKEWTSSLNQTSNFKVNYNVTNAKLN